MFVWEGHLLHPQYKSFDSHHQISYHILCLLYFKGGLEAFEDNIRREEEEKEAAKRKEEERRLEISQTTRNRLSKLLDRKRAEVKDELER